MPHRWAPSPYQRKEQLVTKKTPPPIPTQPPYRIYTLSLTPVRMSDTLTWCYIVFPQQINVETEQQRLHQHFPHCTVYSGWAHPPKQNTWILVSFPKPVRVSKLLSAAEQLWASKT